MSKGVIIMYIESTKENLFNLFDVYESLILHCGLEYAESVMRIVNKDKEQSDYKTDLIDKIAMLESDYDDMESQVTSMQCIVNDAVSQLEYIMNKSRVKKSDIEDVYNTLSEAI